MKIRIFDRLAFAHKKSLFAIWSWRFMYFVSGLGLAAFFFCVIFAVADLFSIAGEQNMLTTKHTILQTLISSMIGGGALFWFFNKKMKKGEQRSVLVGFCIGSGFGGALFFKFYTPFFN